MFGEAPAVVALHEEPAKMHAAKVAQDWVLERLGFGEKRPWLPWVVVGTGNVAGSAHSAHLCGRYLVVQFELK